MAKIEATLKINEVQNLVNQVLGNYYLAREITYKVEPSKEDTTFVVTVETVDGSQIRDFFTETDFRFWNWSEKFKTTE